MFRSLTVVWTIAVVAVFLAGAGWIRSERMLARAQKSESILENQERLRIASSDLDPATFISYADNIVTYAVPNQIQLNGETFVSSVEQQAALIGWAELYGFSGTDDKAALSQVPRGTPIRIRTSSDPTGKLQIDALFIVP